MSLRGAIAGQLARAYPASSFRAPHKIARRLRITPVVSRKMRNWTSFVSNYAWGRVPRSPYVFRNGAQVQIGRGVDHVPIIEIFLREDYGVIPDGATILDLGANIGVFSVYAATTARDVRIFAYEPEPDFFALLERNVTANELESVVTCCNAGVAGAAGKRDLFHATKDFAFPTLVGGSDALSSVNCLGLAEILQAHGLDRVDLVKMDVEGAEYEVLLDAPADVLARIGELRLEYHELDTDRRNVAHLRDELAARGFEITRFEPVTSTNGNLWARRR